MFYSGFMEYKFGNFLKNALSVYHVYTYRKTGDA